MNSLRQLCSRLLGVLSPRAIAADPRVGKVDIAADIAAADSLGHPHVQAIRYLVVSEACSAAMSAIDAGDLHQAELHAAHAWSLDPAHPDAVRTRALLAILTGAADQAVELLERAASTLPAMRLLLQLARLQSGQREAAHLDLHSWSRQKSCPPQARQLLAHLEQQAGDDTAARAALQANLRNHLDPASAQMLYLIDRKAGWRDSAKRTASLLAHRLPHHAPTRSFEQLMGMADRDKSQVPLQMIDQLAAELIECPQAIASLVLAQKHTHQPQRVELLRRALNRIVDDLSHPLEAIIALAELALLADDADDAKRWAMRGLRIDAYHAKLALLLDKADRRCDGSAADEARASLQRAAIVHGEYPDVRRALTQRLVGEIAA